MCVCVCEYEGTCLSVCVPRCVSVDLLPPDLQLVLVDDLRQAVVGLQDLR